MASRKPRTSDRITDQNVAEELLEQEQRDRRRNQCTRWQSFCFYS